MTAAGVVNAPNARKKHNERCLTSVIIRELVVAFPTWWKEHKLTTTHHEFEQVILDVAGAVAFGEGRAVGEDDRGFGGFQGVQWRLVGRVGEVDDHPQTIHLLYHSLIKKKRNTWKKLVGTSFPSNLSSALQSYCSHLSVSLLSYESRSTPEARKKNWTGSYTSSYIPDNTKWSNCKPAISTEDVSRNIRPIFFLRSSRIRFDLLSYESKPTDKREQYDWRAEKSLDL